MKEAYRIKQASVDQFYSVRLDFRQVADILRMLAVGTDVQSENSRLLSEINTPKRWIEESDKSLAEFVTLAQRCGLLGQDSPNWLALADVAQLYLEMEPRRVRDMTVHELVGRIEASRKQMWHEGFRLGRESRDHIQNAAEGAKITREYSSRLRKQTSAEDPDPQSQDLVAQLKAAREMAGHSQFDAATEMELEESAVKRFEQRKTRKPRNSTQKKIKDYIAKHRKSPAKAP